ncbi:succinylglutamate desuccinylase/aspartoacylase family protein [Xylophilus sp.]|uniref:succinylglutamate desuccinylase/aspartoacylase family protein n=1 Tax=Xylophilus sp. TaxID=2653893 RepID=UPI0013B6F6E0|nr:succinylglutamate desuccinylase/aspartoacylase family protein [Xylophilus sp.]KAF1049828.1 MAG: N-alpha-acetyl-L-2,4-diaminobutyric acid deacetylase [Xylophilus sp.]
MSADKNILCGVRNPIKADIDLDAQGKHLGFLRLPNSVHRSAYGWLPLPVASIKRGQGPTIVVSAGTHGDEYEGQIIVSNLIRAIEPGMVNGQIILLPMANAPAAEVGMRTSPLDDGNLNRLYPGDPLGTPSQIIAHYIEHTLLARADYMVDLHSGGSSLLYQSGNAMGLEPRDVQESERVTALLQAFGMPKSFLYQPNPVNVTAAARRQNAICFLAELGGGGNVDPALVKMGTQGLLNLLGFIQVLAGPLLPEGPPAATRLMTIDRDTHYTYAMDAGVYEPLAALGDVVRQGQEVARVHFPADPGRQSAVVLASGDGEIVCQRAMALVRRGDCIFQLASERSLPRAGR